MRTPKLLTRRQLADVLDNHPMTITKWEQEGLPVAVRGRRGKASLYRVSAVRTWLADREARSQLGDTVDLVRERAARERSQALLNDQTFQLRAGKLLPADEVEKKLAGFIAAVRSKLLAWEMTLSDRVHRAGALEGVSGTARTLHEAVYEVLRELATDDAVTATTETKETRSSVA